MAAGNLNLDKIMSKKIIKILAKLLAVFIIAVCAVILTQHYLFPWLSSTKIFSQYKFLEKAAENVTIINKTEQVTVKEDDLVSTVASNAATAVVNIISIGEKKQGSEKDSRPSKDATGVLLTNDGLIVTYQTALLENASSYRVMIFNGENYESELLGIDEFTNLAYFKINATNLPAISLADSSDFRAGKKLIAIGNSGEEYQNRFMAGLLSNVNRNFNIGGKTLSSSEKLEGVFETDFDNADQCLGGPVINYGGELEGIIGKVMIDNQEKFFVIPSNTLKKSLELAIKNELNTRPILGIYYVPITKSYSIINNLTRDRGALIFSSSGRQGLAIISGTPAEKAGLEINDIIIAVNDQEVNLDNPLSNLLSQYKKGDQVELLIIRDGKELKVPVKL